jgi:hypothetical protein
MNTQNFTTTIVLNETPAQVFEDINNVGAWWQGEIKGNSRHVGDEFEYRMLSFHYSKQKVVEMIPNQKVVWLITESDLSSFRNSTEWNGTKIIFEISQAENKTQLKFTHLGLAPLFECYGDCSGAWSALVERSLYSLITTGKGVKVF